MGYIDKCIDKLRSMGKVPFIMYIFAKFFVGVGIAFLIAGAMPSASWITWGLIFIILAIIFAIPTLKTFLRKY